MEVGVSASASVCKGVGTEEHTGFCRALDFGDFELLNFEVNLLGFNVLPQISPERMFVGRNTA